MQMATPRTSQIDRDLAKVRESMGSRHLLSTKVQRKTRPMSTADLRRRWYEMQRTNRGV